MESVTRRRFVFLGSFAAYFVALWWLWPTVWVYPLKIFVVFLHELSHALAAVATGGSIEAITLDPQQGGATLTRGGSRFFTLSAGYLGSLVWGLVLLLVAQTRPKWARHVVTALSIIVIATTVLYVRNGFGFLFGVLFGVGLLVAARQLPPRGVATLLTVLGLTSALYAVLDIRDDILSRPDAPSDAFMLGELTGIPTLVWGAFWGILALGACALAARRLYQRA